jgi:hypothetical protein
LRNQYLKSNNHFNNYDNNLSNPNQFNNHPQANINYKEYYNKEKTNVDTFNSNFNEDLTLKKNLLPSNLNMQKALNVNKTNNNQINLKNKKHKI